MGIAAFRGALLYVVGERVDAGRGDIRVALQIPVAVEERMGIAAFRGTLLYVVGKRVDAGRGDIRVALQIPLTIK